MCFPHKMDLRTWVYSVLSRAEHTDAEGLANLLFGVTLQPYAGSTDSAIASLIANNKAGWEGWTAFLVAHADFLAGPRTLSKLTASLALFSQVFQDQVQGGWSLPLVHRFTRAVCSLLPAQQRGKSSKKLETVVNELQKLLGICQRTSEKPPDSKLMGLLDVMNALFRLYFRLNNVQLCVNLLKIVNNPHSRLPPIQHFPTADQLEFRFYEGRLSIYEQQIIKAEECLDFCLARCPSGSVRNKRLILEYLIPVKAARGKYPSKGLLERYGRGEVGVVLEAVRKGDVGGFERELGRRQEGFVRTGMLIMMQGLELLTYRNLFKKTAILLGQSQIPFQRLHTALASVDAPVSPDQLECILVRLISKGWVKGYLSHEHKVIVLNKKTSAFPRISEC